MKSVLVTGGTVRLGLAIAQHLRDCGYKVLTVSHRGDSGADIVADFREPLGAAKCYAAAMKLLDGDPPDALVNNAALYRGTDLEIEAINFTAPQKLTMLMAGRETGRGAVVNILDANLERLEIRDERLEIRDKRLDEDVRLTLKDSNRPQCDAKYIDCKARLREYTRSAAAMFAETLRVNAVSPGPVEGLSPVGIHEKAGDCPLGRPKPLDIAKAVAFLLDNDSVTGVDLPVDGGVAVG